MSKIKVFGPTCIDYTIRLKDNLLLDGSARIESEKVFLGGTGLCYAIALSRLGNKIFFHSVIGNDRKGKIIRKSVELEKNIIARWQIFEGSTDYAYILIDDNSHKIAASKKVLTNKFDKNLIRNYLMEKSEAIVISSFKNEIVLSILSNIEKNNKIPFVVWAPNIINCNEIEILKTKLSVIDHITLSFKEFTVLYQKIGNPFDFGVKTVTITKGENGCDLLTPNNVRHYKAIRAVDNPLDTNGAGEAFGAGYITSYLETNDPEISVWAGSYLSFLHIHQHGSNFPRINKNDLIQVARDLKNGRLPKIDIPISN